LKGNNEKKNDLKELLKLKNSILVVEELNQ
jgi:hypothetical protein